MSIDWTRGYSATWRLYEVNRDTWADGERISGVTSASIERTDDGDAPELESSALSVDRPVGEEFRERVLRLAMIAEQDGAIERVDVCTQWYSSASGNTAMGNHARELNGRSVLHTAAKATTALVYGAYVPAGADGAAEVARMLQAGGVNQVNVVGSFIMDEPYVFERSEVVLTSAWAILKAGGFRMRIDGRGVVTVLPRAEMGGDAALSLSDDLVRLVMPSIDDELSMDDVHNRYIAEDKNDTAIAVNDDSASPTSVATRGYYHDLYDTSVTRVNGESLEAYAIRKLAEDSIVRDARQWRREWWPDVYPGDLIRASMRRHGVQGEFRCRRQSLECGAGIVVTERVEREIVTWPIS